MVDASVENKLIAEGYSNVVGVDEAGMSSLAGSVYVGAAVFAPGFDYLNLLPGLDDSKKKSPKQREVLYDLIKTYALASATACATIEEIEEHNIYWARFIAARRAIKNLGVDPGYVLMDGNAIVPEITIPQTAIIKGDTKSISIAAASILAKVERDRYMCGLSVDVSDDFKWTSNNGYGTKAHIEALKKHGKTKYHRPRFVNKYLSE